MRKIMLMILSLIAISFLLVSCGTGKAYVALSTWCTDSDGGKDDYFTFGTATIANNKGVIIKTFKDACLPNELRLTEFYCEGKAYLNRTVDCQYGCSNGACLLFSDDLS